MPEIMPLEWTGDALRILDQTKLPNEQAVAVARSYSDVVQAIQDMQIRGVAPAIGVSVAYAIVLAAKRVNILNPAFDVTPHRYISAIITERDIIQPPYEEELRRLMGHEQVGAPPAVAVEESAGGAIA